MGLLDDAIREHLELKRRRGGDAGEIARQEQEALGPARRGPAPRQVPRPEEGTNGHAQAEDVVPPDEHELAEPAAYEPYPEPAHAPLSPEPPMPPEAPMSAAEEEEEDSLADARGPEEPLDSSTRAFSSLEEAEAAGAMAPAEPEPAAPEHFAPEPEQFAPPVEDHLAPGPEDHLAPGPEEVFPAPQEPPPPLPEEHAPLPEEEPPLPEEHNLPPEEHHLPPEEDASEAEHPPEGQPPAEGEGDDVLEETPEFLQETPEHDRLWFEQRPPRDFDFDK